MNKKILGSLLLLAIVVAGLTYFLYTKTKEQSLYIAPAESNIATSTNVVNFQPLKKYPFTFDEYFKDEKSTPTNITTSYGSLSFKELTDIEHQARNSTFDVLLGTEKIGELGGQGFSIGKLSPDNSKYAFRSRSILGCAGMCQGFGIYITDLKNKNVTHISYPKTAFKYEVDNPRTQQTNDFIESYFWKDSNTIIIKTSLVLMENGKDFYRISPKQLWEYDVTTQKYTLIQTLREDKVSTPYTPTPIDSASLSTSSGTFTEDRSPDGKYISHTYDSEGGDAGIFITNSAGNKVTASYCGYFREWSSDSKSVTVFVPEVCAYAVNDDETFRLYIDGTISR